MIATWARKHLRGIPCMERIIDFIKRKSYENNVRVPREYLP